MIEMTIVTALVLGIVVGPLAWRVARDRAEARALEVRAEIDAVARHELGGESMLAIDVRPSTVWSRGRIVLSAPQQWEWLVEAVVKSALERTPADYDLIVPATGRKPALAAQQLKAAA
jgi:hypothetical protein